ncbi:NAD(P)H-hydrate dehydratase [Hymenobacter glacieicola]|uniref:Bifunctional NAD(P)H-hydrate repair enzyme n=1 Tax=Hymenobacter glacieicola TaxID=1562124 RepID=A0ABQ1WUB3_9BACT|nr:NAD(P)H-hydrate dehydratase [Hymenobacter glacieicola]GGG45922.1 bifunctional NAD(P)H-hydrate repair enzyme [Hymenobacter glacieicola]
MKILTAAQTRQADAATLQAEGITSAELMERAATAFCEWLLNRLPLPGQRPIYIFCGPGNNGGDGLAVARQLHEAGYQPQVWGLPAARPSADFTLNRRRLPTEVPYQEVDAKKLPPLPAHALVIDALFGTGLSRPLTGAAATLVQHLNQSGAAIVAVDLPSGLFADAPQSPDSPVVRAHHTVSFELPKLAFLLPQNAEFVGEWEVLPIHLDSAFIHNTSVDNYFVDDNVIRGRLPARSKFSHKGTFGHVLLLAGSRGKIGASVLAARACLRGGVGLLTVRIPAVGYHIMQTSAPEAMTLADPATDFVTELPDLKPYAAIGIGPGLGQEHATCEVLRQLLRKANVPLVLDADALNLLGANPGLLPLLPRESLLTPHPKEFERLVGKPARDDYHRLEQLRTFAREYKCYCVLKGAYTTLAAPDGTLYFNSTGNPGMATGGSGDVLTGLLLALRADKRLSPLDAALLGLYAHGRAGDRAAQQTGEAGLVAGDLVRFIGPVLQELTATPPRL